MCLFVRGLVPSRKNLVRLARVLTPGLVGVVLSACASQQAPHYAGVYQRVAERDWKAEVEADGRPAQAPPIRTMRPEEDDPSQPWSQNYGKGPGSKQMPSPQPVSRQMAPRLIDTNVQDGVAVQPSRKLTSAEADQVILRAIQSHETRRP